MTCCVFQRASFRTAGSRRGVPGGGGDRRVLQPRRKWRTIPCASRDHAARAEPQPRPLRTTSVRIHVQILKLQIVSFFLVYSQ